MAGETYAVPMDKPAKLGEQHVLLPTAAKQVIMDDNDTERLPAALARKFDASHQLTLEEYAAMNPKPALSAVMDKVPKFGDVYDLSQHLNDIANVKEYSAIFSNTKAYGNYTCFLFIRTTQQPTIANAHVYNGYSDTDITNEAIISDYHTNSFSIKCPNDICAGSVVVVNFN